MIFIFRKLKILIFIFTISLNYNPYSNAHMRGTFISEEEAIKKALEIGCSQIHKNQDKWLPCENEKELHEYLRK